MELSTEMGDLGKMSSSVLVEDTQDCKGCKRALENEDNQFKIYSSCLTGMGSSRAIGQSSRKERVKASFHHAEKSRIFLLLM